MQVEGISLSELQQTWGAYCVVAFTCSERRCACSTQSKRSKVLEPAVTTCPEEACSRRTGLQLTQFSTLEILDYLQGMGGTLGASVL